ncbi:MAG: hypothetical protein HZC02_05330 [Candidatus Levybacteria bacterium]|nr:hypothetical protein [Candidatus Levybacteria bacterium]
MAERLQSEVLTDDVNPTADVAPTHSTVDPYRANRELERWLFGGVNIDDQPRPDQHGTSDTYEGLYEAPQSSVSTKGEHFMTIVYNHQEGTVRYLHRGDPGFEIETSSEEETA